MTVSSVMCFLFFLPLALSFQSRQLHSHSFSHRFVTLGNSLQLTHGRALNGADEPSYEVDPNDAGQYPPCSNDQKFLNGTSGDCESSLESGTTCSPKCDEGFKLDGPTRCYKGELIASTCLPNCYGLCGYGTVCDKKKRIKMQCTVKKAKKKRLYYLCY